MDKKVMVIGGAGFISLHPTDKLNYKIYQLTIYDITKLI